MPFHGLRHPQLVGLETGKLLGIAEAGFHIPAAALAADQDLPLPREIIAHDVVQTSPAVRGHGEADISVAREVDSAYPSPGAARDTAGKPSRQDAQRFRQEVGKNSHQATTPSRVTSMPSLYSTPA